jgi:CHAD domain-containing protein
VARLEEAGAVVGEARPKLVRAIGPRAAEPADVVPVQVKRNASMAEVIRAAIAHGYQRLLAHDLGVRLDEDPEDVHQARVATRRLRSDLRTFREFLPAGWAAETRAELGWVAEALGRARDADVLFERLQREVDSLDGRDAGAAASLLGRLVTERDRAHEHLMEVFSSDRYAALLDGLVQSARELPPLKPAGEAAGPGPAGPVPAGPVPAGSVPAGPVPAGPVPAGSVPAGSVPAGSGGQAGPGASNGAAVGPGAADLPAAADQPAGADPAAAANPPAAADLPAAANPPAAVPAEAAFQSGTTIRPVVQPISETAGLALTTVPAPLSPESSSHPPRPDRDHPARELAPSVVSGPWRHLARAVAALGTHPADAALHEIRIRAKRLRYACEAVAEVVGKPAVEMARAAAGLQGVLGDFHDAIVAEDWLRAAAVDASTAQALAAGQLIARQREDAARCRSEWEESWKRLDHKKQRAWLR